MVGSGAGKPVSEIEKQTTIVIRALKNRETNHDTRHTTSPALEGKPSRAGRLVVACEMAQSCYLLGDVTQDVAQDLSSGCAGGIFGSSASHVLDAGVLALLSGDGV